MTLRIENNVAALLTGGVLVIHSDGTITPYPPTSNTDAARGTALLNAAASLVNGDTIKLAAETFDIGANTIDLSVGQTITASLKGSGKYLTIIKSSRNATISPIISPGLNGSETTDLSIIGTAAAFTFQTPWGGTGYYTNAILENVYIQASSDCVLIEDFNGTQYATVTIRNMTTSSNFDSINAQSATVYVYDSVLTSVPGNGFTATNRGVVNAALLGIPTTIYSFNNILSSSGGSTSNTGYEMDISSSGTTIVYGGSITTSGIGAYDLENNAGGSLTVFPDVNYTPEKTLGTITYDRYYQKGQIDYVAGTGIMDSDGSGNITGTGTKFLTELSIGSKFWLPGEGTGARVISISSDTALKCYPDPGAAGDTFIYIPPMAIFIAREINPGFGTESGKISIGADGTILMNGFTGPEANIYPLEIHTNVSSGANWVQIKVTNDADGVAGFAMDSNGGLDPQWLFYRYGSNPASAGYPANRFNIGVNGAFESFGISPNTRGVGIGSGFASSGVPYDMPADGLVVKGIIGAGTSAPTALIHIKAGTASASTAPLKFTTGTNLTTAEAGAMEYANPDLFFTPSSAIRYNLPLVTGAGVQGDIIYVSAASIYSRLAKNTTASRYLSNSGSSNNPAWAQVDLTNGVTGTLPVANGGTNSTIKFTDNVTLTNQSADIAATAFTHGNVAGLYRVGYSLEDTTADVTAGTVTLTLAWTDDAGATTVTATQLLTGTGRVRGNEYIQLASGNLTYAITHTGIFGAAKYALYATCERLN